MIAREQRRRQAQEALEFERDRASSLEEQVEAIVAELEGPRIDEETFATMAPEDVEVVRVALLLDGDREGSENEWPELEGVSFEDDPEETETGTEDDTEDEIARLQEEIAASRRRQEALERYIHALMRLPDAGLPPRPTAA